jgi:hypothetical protein
MAHQHKAIEDTRTTAGYVTCVAGTRCNPRSHGGVTHMDRCACGAMRKINSTGDPNRREIGAWTEA